MPTESVIYTNRRDVRRRIVRVVIERGLVDVKHNGHLRGHRVLSLDIVSHVGGPLLNEAGNDILSAIS